MRQLPPLPPTSQAPRPTFSAKASRLTLLLGSALMLGACGGGGGPGPSSLATNTPVAPPPAPAPNPPAPSVNYNTAEYQRSNAASQANAMPAWESGATGKGVTVAVIDSGLSDPGGEFHGRIASASRDTTGQNRTIADPSGHGTAVAGVLAAGRNDAGIVGVAPGATLAIMRADGNNCAEKCHFSDTAIAASIDAAINAGARVINISLGGSSAGQSLRSAFQRASAADRVIVISAGNDGEAEADPLARAALTAAGGNHVIIAGASNANGILSDFSNQAGSTKDNFLVALGERVRSFNADGQATLYSGTSFAAPAVSGALALLAESFPELSGSDLVSILLSSADDAGATGTDIVYGRGLLNIGSAMAPSGRTHLAGTSIPVSIADSGTLGSAFGDGLSHSHGLQSVQVTDSYGRRYALSLASSLRHAGAGRLRGRLQSTSLRHADTSASVGGFDFGLQIRATDRARPVQSDALRRNDVDLAPLGFALRGLDAHAGNRNPLRETRLSLMAPGGFGFALATGQMAAETLPGSTTQGFVSNDGLSADDGSGSNGHLLMMAQKVEGPFTLALAASRRNLSLPSRQPGLPQSGNQHRLTLAASLDQDPWQLSLQASHSKERGAFLGTSLAPGYGLQGGRILTVGGAAQFEHQGLLLRAAGSTGWAKPDFADLALMQADGLLKISSWSLSASRPIGPGRLRAQFSSPLVVTSGQFRLANGAPITASASARETVAELGYEAGPLSLALFQRRNAGNIAGLVDRGAAFTLRAGF